MAQPTTLRFSKFKVLLETTPGSGLFSAPCGFTENSLVLTADTNSQLIPDCDDPDAPIWQGREKTARSAAVSGAGVIAMEDFERWREAYDSDLPVLCQIRLDLPGASGGGRYEGNFHLSSLQLGRTYGQKGTLSVNLESDGVVAWIDAA